MSYLEYWAAAAMENDNEIEGRLADLAGRLVQSRSDWRKVVSDALAWLPTTVADPQVVVNDVVEDKAAWEAAAAEIRAERGCHPNLDELLQGFALSPKEPPADPNSVRLMTIHATKGLEFDCVWLPGVAESILPSWQSLKPSAKPTELEEERRNFFVAITRTRKRLILSHAKRYGGWAREPSRFVEEINLSPQR